MPYSFNPFTGQPDIVGSSGTGSHTLGMSNLGNTSGTTGVVSGSAVQFVLAGGNNITLSQSLDAGNISGTITISAGAGGAAGSHTVGMSNLGNTSGTSGVVSGSAIRYLFAGGNNITLSQSLDAGNVSGTVTISAFNQTAPVVSNALQTVASATGSGTNTSRFAADDHVHAGVGQFQISGNTSNTSNVVFGSVVLAGGNNVTLSQVSAAGAATITISAANETQTVPPIGTQVTEVMSAGSTGTITRFAPEDHAHRGVNLVQISGNTSNTSNVIYGSVYLAGGNNITLSQVSAAGKATITISAANETQTVPPIATQVTEVMSAGSTGTITRFAPEDHAHRGINLVQISGNTSNTSNIIYGSVYLAGGNNITLSQVSAAGKATITISAANETQTVPPIATQVTEVMSAGSTGTITRFAPEDHAHRGVNLVQISGNTSNTSNVVYGSVYLAGGNNITLSQVSAAGKATITISAANETQTVPPIGTAVKVVQSSGSTGTITRFAPEDHAHQGVAGIDVQGVASTFFGTYQLSAGALISIATGGNTSRGSAQIINLISTATTVSSVTSANAVGADVSRYAVEGHQHAGVGPAGVSNIGNTNGNTSVMHGRLVLAGGNNITLSQSTSNNNAMTVTISGGLTGPSLVFWHNLIGATNRVQESAVERSLWIAPLYYGQPFPGNMTVSTLHLHLSASHTNTSASTEANSTKWSVGIYTLNGNTLSLLNSASTSWGFAANSNMSSNFHGYRMLSFHSSLFSVQPVFSQTNYWIGLWHQTSGTSFSAFSFRIQLYGQSDQMSGTIGASTVTGTSMGSHPFAPGIYSASFTTGMPTALQASDIAHNVAMAQNTPIVVFDNVTANF